MPSLVLRGTLLGSPDGLRHGTYKLKNLLQFWKLFIAGLLSADVTSF